MPLSSLAVFLRSQGPETPGGSWAATAGGLRPRPSGPMAAASDKSGQGSQEHGGCGCPPQCSPERPPLSTTVQCHRRCRRLGFMDTFRPPPQPSRMKLCSVPVTPDPGFPPQGQPLFSLPPAREVRPDAPSGQHSFSPPSSQAPPLPFQGSRPQERPSGRAPGPPAPTAWQRRPRHPNSPGARWPSSARSLFPISRSCSFSRQRRRIFRVASFSFLWSRGTDKACGGCGPWSSVAVGLWSAGLWERSRRQAARKTSCPAGRGTSGWGQSLQHRGTEG